MPEPARIGGSGIEPEGPREILIEGEERFAKTNDPLVSGHIADQATSGNRLDSEETQHTVAQRGQTETVASNVVDPVGDKSAAANINDGGSAAPPPPSDEPDFGAEAQRAADLDHLSLAPQHTYQAADDPAAHDTAIASPEGIDDVAMSDPGPGTVGPLDSLTLIDADPVADFDWTKHFDAVELPDPGPLPAFDDFDLSPPSDTETPY